MKIPTVRWKHINTMWAARYSDTRFYRVMEKNGKTALCQSRFDYCQGVHGKVIGDNAGYEDPENWRVLAYEGEKKGFLKHLLKMLMVLSEDDK